MLRQPVALELLVNGIDAIGNINAGPSCRLARKYRIGRSSERAMRTVLPSRATKANEPSISRTASGFPDKGAARFLQTHIKDTIGGRIVRSTTRSRY